MRKHMKLAAFCMSAVMAFGGTSFAWAEAVEDTEAEEITEEDVEEVDYIKDVPYIDDGNVYHLLDVFGAEDTEEKKPTILEVHGGGFFGGDKETNTDHSKYYEENGFAVVTPNYTLMPEANFIDVIQELFTVMHWMEDNAEEYHLDLDNAFIGGDSAGGFLVELTALVLSSEELQQAYEVTPPSFAFKGYVVSCPVVDIMGLRDLIEDGSGFNHFMATQIQDVLLDDSVMQYADLLSLIDPETYPELYIIAAADDKILYDDAILLDEFLTEHNMSHEFKMYSNDERYLGHVFNVTNVGIEDSIAANDAAIAYLKEKIS